MPERDDLRTWRKLGLDSCWKEKTYKNTITHKTFVKGTNGKTVDRSKTRKETKETKIIQFDRKKFNKIVTGLLKDRLDEIYNQTRKNPQADMQIEDKLAQAIQDIDQKYNISGAIRQYSVNPEASTDLDLSPTMLFAEKSEQELNKMFYRNIPAREACELARTRIESAKSKYDGVAQEFSNNPEAMQREQAGYIRGAIRAYSDLEKIHNNRSIFFRLFNYSKFSGEKHNLDFFKRNIMEQFNINNRQFDATLKDINKSPISSEMAEQFKITGMIKQSIQNNPNKAREYAEQQIDRSNKRYNKATMFTTAGEDAKATEARAKEEVSDIRAYVAKGALEDDYEEDEVENDRQPLPPIEKANPVDKNAEKSDPPRQIDAPQNNLSRD